LSEKLDAPLHMAGVIILITGAGGAFGGMIRLAGVGETIQALADKFNISYILLAWLATAVVRIAQGSATVAMITGVGLMAAVIGDGAGLAYHPLYIFLAVGFGSITLSWMNDSGFWVVQRLSGFTEKETLRTWSVLLTAISLLGLVEILVFSRILPFAG
jgi:GntP family gluconate:H+ symporter